MSTSQGPQEKNFNTELAEIIDRCSSSLSFDDISRLNGIRLELLRRYIDRQAKNIRAETWDKIYPLLKPYLEGPEPIKSAPPCIGNTYRRHPELVEMKSEQKVLLDEFAIFSDAEKKKIIRHFAAALESPAEATKFTSLSHDENVLMGNYLALPPEKQDELLAELTEKATAEVRRQRKELF
jgi:hypothetical protein